MNKQKLLSLLITSFLISLPAKAVSQMDFVLDKQNMYPQNQELDYSSFLNPPTLPTYQTIYEINSFFETKKFVGFYITPFFPQSKETFKSRSCVALKNQAHFTVDEGLSTYIAIFELLRQNTALNSDSSSEPDIPIPSPQPILQPGSDSSSEPDIPIPSPQPILQPGSDSSSEPDIPIPSPQPILQPGSDSSSEPDIPIPSPQPILQPGSDSSSEPDIPIPSPQPILQPGSESKDALTALFLKNSGIYENSKINPLAISINLQRDENLRPYLQDSTLDFVLLQKPALYQTTFKEEGGLTLPNGDYSQHFKQWLDFDENNFINNNWLNRFKAYIHPCQ